MKYFTKWSVSLLFGTLTVSQLYAQTIDSSKTSATHDYVTPFSGSGAFRTWSIGVSGGVLSPYTPFGGNPRQDFTSPDGRIGYGAYIKDQLIPSFGIRLDYLGGQLRGDDAQPVANGISPYTQFDTRLYYGLSLSGEVTLANISWHYNKSAIQPYLTFGGGFMNYKPVLHLADGTVENFRSDNNGKVNEFYIPLGLGLKFDIARGINLDLGYQVNFVNSDNVDGYNFGYGYDRYSYAHIGLEFALGSRSKPQLSTHNPVSSMRREYLDKTHQLEASLQQQQVQLDQEKTQNTQLRMD